MHPRTAIVLALVMAIAGPAGAACCFFSAKDRDINQPGQKSFITWDPQEKRETFTVQAKFEGNALDFGMVIPTPTRPKLDEMPRDLFKHLALLTILLPFPQRIQTAVEHASMMSNRNKRRSMAGAYGGAMPTAMRAPMPPDRGVKVLEAGVVGSLDYKIITAEIPEGLFLWLKENGYNYAGDSATLAHYIDKKWIFTVMKIDSKQMKKNPDGTFLGEVTPTRLAFSTDEFIYPLKITAISVKHNTEALLYVQAPAQMDLKDNWSWMWSYRVMYLNSGTVCISQKQMTSEEQQELASRQQHLARIRQEIPQFDTTKLEWARRLGRSEESLLDDPLTHYAQGGLPDLPNGAQVVSLQDMQDEFTAEFDRWAGVTNGPDAFPTAGEPSAPSDGRNQNRQAAMAYIQGLQQSYPKDKGVVIRAPKAGGPGYDFHWFPNREAPAEDVKKLSQLKGLLKTGHFLTKMRKTFLKHEMNKDLEIVPVPHEKEQEYMRILPQSPP